MSDIKAGICLNSHEKEWVLISGSVEEKTLAVIDCVKRCKDAFGGLNFMCPHNELF